MKENMHLKMVNYLNNGMMQILDFENYIAVCCFTLITHKKLSPFFLIAKSKY